jgi:Na+-driven multidrug efflux pump
MFVQIANFGVILIHARGTQSLVGRHIGARQREEAAHALAQGLGLALRVVVPLTALQWIFAPELLRFMGGEGEAVEQATLFLRTLFLFMPALYVSPILDFSFQALGDTRTPFRLQLLALSVNAALNWLLVFPHELALGGAHLHLGGWGVAGSAVATGLSRLLAALLGFALFLRRYRFAALLEGQELPRRAAGRARDPARGAAGRQLDADLLGRRRLRAAGRGALRPGRLRRLRHRFPGRRELLLHGRARHRHGHGHRGRARRRRRRLPRVRRAGHVGAAAGATCMLVTGMIFRFFPSELAGSTPATPTSRSRPRATSTRWLCARCRSPSR